jgi:hypothetical protein
MNQIQAELDDSARRNTELQKQVQALRVELEALRSARPSADVKKARPEDRADAKDGHRVEVGKAKLGIPAAPQYVRFKSNRGEGQFGEGAVDAILVISPEGDKATVFFPESKRVKSLRLSEDKKTAREVMPIVAPGVVGLWMKGPGIARVAVFNEINATWYPVELREPVDEASPIVGPESVVYTLGRRIYAFTCAARRWDVLEFPEGTRPTPTVGPGSISYEHDGHIYTFNNQSGKWDDLDTRAILDAPEDQEEAKPKPK